MSFKEKAKRRYNLSPIRNVSKMKKEVIFINFAIISYLYLLTRMSMRDTLIRSL